MVGAIGTAIMGLGGMYTVDQGERGVVLHFGEISKVTDPGLNFKTPFIDRVVKVPTRTITGQLNRVLTYSSDQQPDITMSVTFAITNEGVADLYTQFGSVDSVYERIIVPNVKKQTKTVFGQYTAFKSVQLREQLNIDTFNSIEESLVDYPFIKLKSVQIENIDFIKRLFGLKDKDKDMVSANEVKKKGYKYVALRRSGNRTGNNTNTETDDMIMMGSAAYMAMSSDDNCGRSEKIQSVIDSDDSSLVKTSSSSSLHDYGSSSSHGSSSSYSSYDSGSSYDSSSSSSGGFD